MGSPGFPYRLLELDAVKFAPVRYDYSQGRKDGTSDGTGLRTGP